MKSLLCLLLYCLAAFSLLGWGNGHEDHAGLVLSVLPAEIRNHWHENQRRKLITKWSRYPDGHGKLRTDTTLSGILPEADLEFLEKAGINRYQFHHINGKAASFYLLAKSFQADNPEASAFFAGILLHALADAAAFNHGPLIHYYTYTRYEHIESPLPAARMDLSYMRKNEELRNMIKAGLREFKLETFSGEPLKQYLIKVMLTGRSGAGYMCAHEHKLLMPPPIGLEALADIAVYQVREGANLIAAAWQSARSGVKFDFQPDVFTANGALAGEANAILKKKPERDPAMDGVYDGLFTPPEYPAVGVLCEPTAEMDFARLGYGSRFLAAVCARSLKRGGYSVSMIPLEFLRNNELSQENITTLIVCSAGNIPDFAAKTIRKYLDGGGRLIFIGGRGDTGLTGLAPFFIHKADHEVPVSVKYGKANEEVYKQMKVISSNNGEEYQFKANPNRPAGWNKPYSNIAIRLAEGITPLFELDNGKERFCISAANEKSVWLPQYLLMPFLFSDDRKMSDPAHPELDSFGKQIILNALMTINNSKEL